MSKQIKVLNQKIDSRYLNLFRRLYGQEQHIDYFISDIQLSIDYCRATKRLSTITLTDGQNLLGHCSIIKSADDSGFAYFGFFESPDNHEDFLLLWNSVIQEAKRQNIKKLAGPVNGSIWFPYRFLATSNNFPLFKGELPTKPSYHGLLASLPNRQIVSFSSGTRNDFDYIIEATKNLYESVESSGFKLEVLTRVTETILKEIKGLAEAAFSNHSVMYEALPDDYFLKLYNQDKTQDLFGLYIARKGQDIVGFCSVFLEDNTTLIFKTFAVHPSFQRQGIGGAIVHLVHRDAKAQGIRKIIYALVRDGNNIKYYPKEEVTIIRTYSLFAFDL